MTTVRPSFERWCGAILIAACAIFLAAGRVLASEPPATAPTTLPAAQSAFDRIEFGSARPASGQSAPPVHGGDGGLGLTRIIASLAIVLVTILLLRAAARKFFGIQTTGAVSGPLSIVSRCVVGPRQQLMLVQVGKRLVVVASGGAQMNAVCEITDEDEVAALLAQAGTKRPGAAGKSAFASLFGKAEAEIAGDVPDDETPRDAAPAVASTRQEISGLLDKVRTLSKAYRRA